MFLHNAPNNSLVGWHSWYCWYSCNRKSSDTQLEKGYKAALSVSVFQTIGNICCMEDTMGLGKFFTNAVTA